MGRNTGRTETTASLLTAWRLNRVIFVPGPSSCIEHDKTDHPDDHSQDSHESQAVHGLNL